MAPFATRPVDRSMSFLFLVKKLLSVIVLPPLMPLLWVAAGLLLLRRHRRLGLAIAWGGVLVALALSVPSAVGLLISPLESIPVLRAEELAKAQAIVILGGGVRRDTPEYGGSTPNRLTLERLRYGARLARSSGLPVLVSGGAAEGHATEASVMAGSLREDFGVTPRWLEVSSLDTAGNARFSAALLKPQNIERIVLVTHAAHMRRAAAEFRMQGFEVFPAPTAFLSVPGKGEEFFDFLPGATAAYSGWYALHEWVGVLAQKLRLAFGDRAD